MADYHSIIAWAVSQLPRAADEARHAIYEQARTALHKRLGNDPQISDAELVNEHHRLEVAIYEVEEDLLLRGMRRFVREETALSPPSLISKIKEFVLRQETGWACFDLDQSADCTNTLLFQSLALGYGTASYQGGKCYPSPRMGQHDKSLSLI
jgi:hypothetical protein